MNCKLHPTKTAVTTCEVCGAGVCEDCAKQTESIGNYCVKCAYNEIKEDIDFDIDMKAYFKRKNIILLILWVIGVPLIIAGAVVASKSDHITGLVLLLAGITISGIPTAIQFWKKGGEIQNEFDKRFGETYYVSESGVHKDTGLGVRLFSAFMGLFFGVAILPEMIIKNVKFMKEIDAELDELRPVKSKLANFYNSSIKKSK